MACGTWRARRGIVDDDVEEPLVGCASDGHLVRSGTEYNKCFSSRGFDGGLQCYRPGAATGMDKPDQVPLLPRHPMMVNKMHLTDHRLPFIRGKSVAAIGQLSQTEYGA